MLRVVKSGFFTTVQDRGRFGYRNKGVPVSGTMDSFAAKKANAILENHEDSAILEITMTGPTLTFEEDTFICLGGAILLATLNNEPLKNYQVYKVKKGAVLTYGKLIKGFRGYLAIKGGFTMPKVLGSESFYKPVTPKNSLKDNDSLPYGPCQQFEPKILGLDVDSYLDEPILEVFRGPEYGLLTDKQLEDLFFLDFAVSKNNNRMAYQLENLISGHHSSMLTSATLPGTIQLTPAGRLIILMKDGQTTGGYPRILQLSEKAISVLSQKKTAEVISFKPIEKV